MKNKIIKLNYLNMEKNIRNTFEKEKIQDKWIVFYVM